MEPRTAALLRYRFGDLAQMHNHLHVVDGRTLFFWRDDKAALQGTSRVVVEFSFNNSEQVSTLRGAVLSRIEGGDRGNLGLWLEFPDSRLARKADLGLAAIAGRKQRRLGCDLLVEIKVGDAVVMGRMIDVSLGGACIGGTFGLRNGVETVLRLLAPDKEFPSLLGRAEVVRSERDVAVRFVRTDPVARVASSKLFQSVQQAWQKALELSHPPVCCSGGGQVLEPRLPHMKTRA